MWRCWNAGHSLNEIGGALGKDHVVIRFLLARRSETHRALGSETATKAATDCYNSIFLKEPICPSIRKRIWFNSQTKMRELGRIVANADGRKIRALMELYEKLFQAAVHKPPRHSSPINVLMHTLGYFKKNYPCEKSGTFSKCWKHIAKAGHP